MSLPINIRIIRATLIFFGTFVVTLSMAQAHIVFSGRVQMPTHDHEQITMSITNGSDTMIMEIPSSGRFKFTVVENERVSVIFKCNGFITKQIGIDTFHAAGTDGAGQKIEFDVLLEQQPKGKELLYSGPVGKVGFAKRTSSGRPVFVYLPQSRTELIDVTLSASR